MLYGTLEHGYYGEVTSGDFISGNMLATNLNLTYGTAFNSNAGWLKFALGYKTLFVAKRPFRYGISWSQLNTRGVVTGTTHLTINGKTYIVRLLKGRGDGLTTATPAGYDTVPTHGSEWNRLMYHVSSFPNNGAMTSEGIYAGDWARFINVELGMGNAINGSFNWCYDSSSSNKVQRGGDYIALLNTGSSGNMNNLNGWRPVLELVE